MALQEVAYHLGVQPWLQHALLVVTGIGRRQFTGAPPSADTKKSTDGANQYLSPVVSYGVRCLKHQLPVSKKVSGQLTKKAPGKTTDLAAIIALGHSKSRPTCVCSLLLSQKEKTAAQSTTQQQHEVNQQSKIFLFLPPPRKSRGQPPNNKNLPRRHRHEVTQTCSLPLSSVTSQEDSCMDMESTASPIVLSPLSTYLRTAQKTNVAKRVHHSLGQKTRDLTTRDMQQNNGIGSSYSSF